MIWMFGLLVHHVTRLAGRKTCRIVVALIILGPLYELLNCRKYPTNFICLQKEKEHILPTLYEDGISKLHGRKGNELDE